MIPQTAEALVRAVGYEPEERFRSGGLWRLRCTGCGKKRLLTTRRLRLIERCCTTH